MAAETEFEIYAKITAPEGLKAALKIEKQLQAQVRFNDNLRERVRKTEYSGEVDYALTIKSRIDGQTTACWDEETVVIGKKYFDLWLAGCEEYFVKDRYIFKSTNVVLDISEEGKALDPITLPEVLYEVDVFLNPEGESCVWCKIDIEIDRIQDFIKQNYPDIEVGKVDIKVSHLPFKPVEAFVKGEHNTGKQKELIDTLWREVYPHKL